MTEPWRRQTAAPQIAQVWRQRKTYRYPGDNARRLRCAAGKSRYRLKRIPKVRSRRDRSISTAPMRSIPRSVANIRAMAGLRLGLCAERWSCSSRTSPAAADAPAHAIAMHGARPCRRILSPRPTPIPTRPKGGPAGARRARHVRQPQSVHRQGPRRAGDPRLRVRKPDGARL